MIPRPVSKTSEFIDWHTLLNAFGGRKVLVIGDVILDDYLWGDVRRICPEAPVPVVETRRRTSRPGGAGNSAANLVALGAEAWLCGVVGQDSAAEQLRIALREAGVELAGLLVDEDRPTTSKTRIIAHQQQVLRIDTEQTHALSPTLASALLTQVERRIPQADAILLCDYAKGVLSPEIIARLIHLGKDANLPVVIDPKGKDYLRYRGATIIKPNFHELEQLGQRPIQTPLELHRAGNHLMAELEGTAVLVTQGDAGMTLFRPVAEPWHQPAAVPRAVYDVTGAGDTVVSLLALALACRASLVQAVHLANLAAGIVVGKLGTAVVSLSELQNALAGDTARLSLETPT